MHKTCPACGKKESRSLPFIRAFCLNCFIAREKFLELPKALVVRNCARCLRYFIGGEWCELDEEGITDFIVSKIKFSQPLKRVESVFTEVKGGFNVDMVFVFDVEGTDVVKKAVVHVGIERYSCDQCIKFTGGYREAIIQLRGDNLPKLRKLAAQLIKEIERVSFTADFEETRHGIDFAVGNRKAAADSVSRLGLPYTASNTLIGQKQGKRIYRTTLCIRFDTPE